MSVRSFIDLRAFSADSAAAPAGTGFLSGGRSLDLPAGPVAVVSLPLDGAGHVTTPAADMFLILLTGALSIDRTTVAPGDSIVLPAGISFDWHAAPGTTAIVMTCTSGPAGTDHIVPIDHDAPLAPSGAPLAELLVGPTPACRNHTDYRSANGEFLCGTWDSTPYHRRPMAYRHYELMHLLAGSVTFVDETGREATFGEGDIFLVEQGATCSWDSKVDVKKVYAIYRPA